MTEREELLSQGLQEQVRWTLVSSDAGRAPLPSRWVGEPGNLSRSLLTFSLSVATV